MSELSIPGIRLGVAQAGIKYADRDDLTIIEIAEGSSTAAVFTQNAFRAAPVLVAERNNAEGVKAFFQGYLRENAAVSPGAPAAQPAPPKVDMNTLVAPGRPAEATPPRAQDNKRTWTNAQIQRFYSDARNGKYHGRDAEKRKVEEDIFSAPREGRFLG